MSSRKATYIVYGKETERTVSLGTVIRAPESSIDMVLRMLDSIEGVRVVYQKIALYELYITPCPPSHPHSVVNRCEDTAPEKNSRSGLEVSE